MKIIFLTGHRKSGTTMLHKLFDGHPDLVVYPTDICLLYAYIPCLSKDKSKEFAIERIRLVIEKSLFEFTGKSTPNSNVKIDPSQFASLVLDNIDWELAQSRSYIVSVIASCWVDYIGESEEKPFVFKETSQAIYSAEFIADFPEMKIIGLIRDPRDNYAALKSGVDGYYSKMGENEKETLASLINRTRMDFLSIKLNCERFPNNCISIKFEDLTAEPEKYMQKISSFCDIEYMETLTIPTLLGEPYYGNSHEGKKFNGISNKNVNRWKERISDFEAQIIEFWMHDVMDAWDYKRFYSLDECADVFGEFYEWYNCRYFYKDSFTMDEVAGN